MALGNDPLLLLNRADLTLDDRVQLFTYIVLNVHLVVHCFVRYCLLELPCYVFLTEFPVSMTKMIVRFQTKAVK